MQKRFDAVLSGLLLGSGLCPEPADGGLPALLVGVSGGVDSMCLLHLLLHSSVQTQIVVAHCNFHLRGAESDGDEALVREFCAANGLEFCKTDFDTRAYAERNGLSVEIAARELRYGWFAELCAEKGCGAVAVAHNANDNAETLFLNLLRGTGLRGLCGMRPVSVVPITTERETAPTPVPDTAPTSDTAPSSVTEPRHAKIPLLRPLLTFTREEIEGRTRANNIPWREDSTNAASDCRRNILRNEVFPLFAEINPSFIRTVNREMRYFTDASDFVESAVPDLMRDGKIDMGELLAHANWRLFLFHLLRPLNFNSTVIGDISEHIGEGGPRCGSRIFHSPTHRLQVTSKYLLISERSEAEFDDTYIYNTGIYKIIDGTLKEVTAETAGGQGEGRTITIELIPRDSLTGLKAPHGTTCLDADKVRFPFIIRGWRHGDWFRPLGMGGATKKVSDLFVDLKYSVRDKENALFLTLPSDSPSQTDPAEASHILALLGERVDDAVKVSPSTKNVLRLTII